MVISLTNSMTQTHTLFLEWFAICQATKAGRYSLENGNTGSPTYTPAPLLADCHEIIDTAIALMDRSANGWMEWKTEQGQRLDGAKRQTVSALG